MLGWRPQRAKTWASARGRCATFDKAPVLLWGAYPALLCYLPAWQEPFLGFHTSGTLYLLVWGAGWA